MAMAVNFSEVPGYEDTGGHDVSEVYLKFVTLSLELIRESLITLTATTSKAQETQTTLTQENIKKVLDSIEAAKNASFLRRFVEALTYIAIAFSIAATAVTLSPMAMAALAVTLLVTLEPLISKAAGEKSLINEAMNALVQPLIEKFGAYGGVAIALAAIVTACLAMVGLGKLGTNAMAATTNTTVQRCRELLTAAAEWVRSMGGTLNAANQTSLVRFLEVSSSMLMVAQGSMSAAQAHLEYEGAMLMADAGDLKSEADAIQKVISKLVNTDAVEMQRMIKSLLEGIEEYYS